MVLCLYSRNYVLKNNPSTKGNDAIQELGFWPFGAVIGRASHPVRLSRNCVQFRNASPLRHACVHSG